MSMRGIRGATTVSENTKESIFDATKELVAEMIKANNVEIGDICDFIFTVTSDVTAAFPAAAVRGMGICDVPLLDMAAPEIYNSLKMCVRVLMHINTDLGNDSLNHVYLRGAKVLRPDLLKNNKICVAIDGPAGAGKSTVAKTVAADLGYIYIDTGAMYRTVAVWAIENGIDTTADVQRLIDGLTDIRIDIEYVDGLQRMSLNGRDVTERIRQNDASMGASAVATIPEVREYLVDMQRKMAQKGGVIMDGRDIATTVLPNAELKIYLTASVDERARRRFEQYRQSGTECDLDAIKQDVIKRDENDMNRAASPLRRADDAVLLDTTEMDFNETVAAVKNMIKTAEGDC